MQLLFCHRRPRNVLLVLESGRYTAQITARRVSTLNDGIDFKVIVRLWFEQFSIDTVIVVFGPWAGV